MSCALRRVPCQLARLSRPHYTVSSSATGLIRSTWAPRTAPGLFLPPGAVRTLNSSMTTRQESGDEKAQKLDQEGLDEKEQEVRVKQKQVKRPWLREDADKPPAEQGPTSGPTKGKLTRREHPFQLYNHQLTSIFGHRQTSDDADTTTKTHTPTPDPC